MEGILTLILIWLGFAFFGTIVSAVTRTVGAAGKAATGKGSFKGNMDLAFKGMSDFDIQIIDKPLNDDGSGPRIKDIQGKGLFPLSHTKNIGFMISVFDETDGELEPVIAAIETFQEDDSVVYQHSTAIGKIEPNQGFIDWVRLGVVIPDILEPPYSGRRKIKVIVRMVDMDKMPDISHGFHQENDPGLLWQQSLMFIHRFSDKGYKEASEHRDEATGLSLKIGMAVALSDGTLDNSEGEVLKHWVLKQIAPFDDEKKTILKKAYNEAMKESYAAAQNGELILSDLTSRLNEIGEKNSKYETIELCYEVMAADGVADENEIKIIKKIAEALDLDMNEVESMRDQKIIGLNSNLSEHAEIEVILGIENDWTDDQIKKHLRLEFQKWNNRLNTLSEGEDRENAQLMLERISEARKKYA